MRLSISVSDRLFLLGVPILAILLAVLGYLWLGGKAHEMLSQKMNDKHDNITRNLNDWRIDFVVLGTSHSNSVELPSGTHFFNLSEAHNIPTVMYFRAKTLLRHHPEARVVYLEADDHLFFNGQYYTLDGMDPVQKRQSKVFQWNAEFIDGDEEKEAVFGDVAPYVQERFLLLRDDIRPVILKRLVGKFWSSSPAPMAKAQSVPPDTAYCDSARFAPPVDLGEHSAWSARSTPEKRAMLEGRLKEHNLHQPGPLKDTMMAYYDKTITLLKSHGIDVVLVRYPVVTEFATMKNPTGQQQYLDFLQHMMSKHQLRLLDLTGMAQYGERFFVDGDHVEERFQSVLGGAILQDFCTRAQRDAVPERAP